jgi:hypothetical protein
MASPYSRDLSPASSTTITLGATATLAALLATASGAINARLKALWLCPASGVSAYLFKGAAATAAKTLIPDGGVNIACNAVDAATLQLYGSGTVDVWQFVDA